MITVCKDWQWWMLPPPGYLQPECVSLLRLASSLPWAVPSKNTVESALLYICLSFIPFLTQVLVPRPKPHSLGRLEKHLKLADFYPTPNPMGATCSTPF